MNVKILLKALMQFIIVLLFSALFSCKSHEIKVCNYRILVVLAHPDDETLISGTLAKLMAQGSEVVVVFATSGDDGPDMTGRGLYGEALARVRENEAQESLIRIGITKPPLFLKIPDSYVSEHKTELSDRITEIIREYHPGMVITFGPDGVTGDPDHITTGRITDQIFDSCNSGKLLLHVAMSVQASHIYPIPAPVANQLIDMRINVSGYKRIRIRCNKAHRTQFGFGSRLFWKIYVHRFPYEEFIIHRYSDSDQMLQECFGE